MPIIAKDNSDQNYEKIPTGTQHAVCAFVEDIGTHEGNYMGKLITRRQIVVCWELSETMTQGDNAGKPFMISKFYTLSLNQKATLCKDLESWRGKPFTNEERNGFDVEKLIGVNCLLNIIEQEKTDGNTFCKVASISPPLKNMDKLEVVNKKPPEWINELRKRSIEYNEPETRTFDQSEMQYSEDDLPF